MKKALQNLLFAIITLALLAGSLWYLTSLFELKGARIKYEDFYAQEEDFDVLFLGTSHVINAVYPMELWEDYGIVSYNMAGHGNKMPTTYWVFENALLETTPKLVVIDC